MKCAERITDILRRHPEVQVAWLFGSAASGRLTPDSDLDVAVLGRGPLSAAATKPLIEQMAQACRRPVDLVDLQATHGPIVGRVLQEGERLFCDDTTLYADLMKRHMFDQADWLPLRRRILDIRRRAWIES